MNSQPITLNQFAFIAREQHPEMDELGALLEDIGNACKRIAHECSRGALRGIHGYNDEENVQGEAQKKIDVLANDIFIHANQYGRHVSALISEEMEAAWLPHQSRRGPFLLFFDPLDGSSNSDINVSVGSIFSVLRAPPHYASEDFNESWALKSGVHQVAAGYAIYGQATMLVITMGEGTHGFTLDRDVGDFVLTHPNLTISATCAEYAINASNHRHWQTPVRDYIDECVAGKTGARQKDFNMRWVASLVADAHRILMRGGIFLYPYDNRDPKKPGKLRLMYECNPIAWLIEQAGGMATTGRERVLEINPDSLHQRVPFIFGSREEVERVIAKHQGKC